MTIEAANAEVLAADGTKIAYAFRRSAARPKARVLLVHALAQDRSNWDGVVAALPDEIHTLAVDCRGHGASGSGTSAFTPDLMAEDLTAVMDDAGWPGAIVAGCSMGGCVAQAFAARHADRTEGLALIDTTAWYGPDAAANWQERSERARSEGLGALIDFQLDRWFSTDFKLRNPELVRKTIDVFLHTDLDAYGASCAMLGQVDLRSSNASITCPTTVIVGEEDYATPVAAAEALQRQITRSKLVVLKAARHFTPIERPGEVASEIRALADRLEAETTA